MEVSALRGIALILGAWLTTIRNTIRSSRAIPRPSSSSSHAKIKNIGRRVMLAVARAGKSARRLRVHARAPLLRAMRDRGPLVRTRLVRGPQVLRARVALRLPATRESTLRAVQVGRYRRRASPAAAKRQVERLPPCRRARLRARRDPRPRSRPCKPPSPSPCSPVLTARRTTSWAFSSACCWRSRSRCSATTSSSSTR